MNAIDVKYAKKKLGQLLAGVNESHEPVYIVGKKSSAVMISEEDWSAIEETLCLLSMPGMRQSIIKGLKTPIEKCLKKLDW
ncbi:type II toxin-antitoxin system Phd/YefM family antitoxin [Candidatus Saganbacteria bacterium]|nr:type II toxin-antitoxin system Phd/YefM family antitoxin [Candidatus Saganbacteria bacterium]